MYDLILDTVYNFIKHGWGLPLLVGVLVALLKQRPSKRWIRKRLPWLLRDAADVANYEARQIRIEAKIDALMSAGGVTWDAEKMPSLPNGARQGWRLRWLAGYRAAIAELYTKRRRRRKMREYLKKLGRTKFQAFLIATLTNIGLLLGYILDVQDVQSKVSEWTPLILAASQLVAGAVYQYVEGGVDKAKAKAEVPDAAYTSREDAGDV